MAAPVKTVSTPSPDATPKAEAVKPDAAKTGVVPGTKSYRLTKPHYRQGRYYQPGEIITVTDEKPGKSWVPVEAGAVAATPSPEKSPAGRAADQTL